MNDKDNYGKTALMLSIGAGNDMNTVIYKWHEYNIGNIYMYISYNISSALRGNDTAM